MLDKQRVGEMDREKQRDDERHTERNIDRQTDIDMSRKTRKKIWKITYFLTRGPSALKADPDTIGQQLHVFSKHDFYSDKNNKIFEDQRIWETVWQRYLQCKWRDTSCA